MNKDLTLEEIVYKIYETSETWATTAAIYHRYREGEKSVLAKIKHNIRQNSNPPDGKKGWTREDIEEYALASSEWEKFLKEYSEAYEVMLKAKNDMEAYQSLFEARRSTMASERVLNKIG